MPWKQDLLHYENAIYNIFKYYISLRKIFFNIITNIIYFYLCLIYRQNAESFVLLLRHKWLIVKVKISNGFIMKRRRSLRSTRTNSLWIDFLYNFLFYCWILSYLIVEIAVNAEVSIGCPPSEAILPCRCSLRGKEIQIW